MTLFPRMNTNKDGKVGEKSHLHKLTNFFNTNFFSSTVMEWNTHTGLWHIKRSKGYINATFKNQMKASQMTVSEDITVP